MSTPQTIQPPDAMAIRQSAELQATRDAVREAQEVRAAIQLAREYPRSEEEAYQRLLRSCRRPSFADGANYKFKRGRKQDNNGNWVDNFVEGASVGLAREFARCWGNFQFGFTIIRDDEDSRTIRGFAWDVETNTRKTQDATFAKLIQRRVNGESVWVEPDERDLRELTNKHGSIAERNVTLQLLPKDYIDDAMRACKETLRNHAAADPDAAKKRIVVAFDEIGVPVSQLEELLGHALSTASPAEITDLRAIWKSISDGNSTWSEYINAGQGDEGGSPNTTLSARSQSRLKDALDRAGASTPGPKPATDPMEEARAAQAKLDQERKNANTQPPATMTAAGDIQAPKIPPSNPVAEPAASGSQAPQASGSSEPTGKGHGRKHDGGLPMKFE